MAYRLYIVPKIGTGVRTDPYRPKYFSDLNYNVGLLDYGMQAIYMASGDLSPTDDAFVAGKADVITFPFDLSTTVGGGNVQQARAALEAVFIPAQTVNGQDTWLAVARMCGGCFIFMSRLAVSITLVLDTAYLNTQWSAIPVNIQNAILDTAQFFGYDTTFIRNNTQVRTIITTFADAWGNKPFVIGEMTI